MTSGFILPNVPPDQCGINEIRPTRRPHLDFGGFRGDYGSLAVGEDAAAETRHAGGQEQRSASMTAETTRRPVRKESFRQRMVRYWIMLATVTYVLRDRRFQSRAITVAIGAVALAQLGRDNQARPLRRATAWYS